MPKPPIGYCIGSYYRVGLSKQCTGVGRFSPIRVHDKAYRQIPLNFAKANAENLFDRIAVHIRRPNGQLQIGLDQTSDQAKPVDFSTEFEHLRQPIFDQLFYHQQWLALSELARQRGENNEAYLNQIDEFIGLFGQD